LFLQTFSRNIRSPNIVALSCPFCHVLACFVRADLPRLTYQTNLSRLIHSGTPVPVVLSKKSYPKYPVTAVLPQFPRPGGPPRCHFLVVMFWPPVLSFLSYLHYLDCPRRLSYPGGPVPAVLFFAVLSQLSCPSCPALEILSQLSCPCCPAPAVFLSVLFTL
jgi:hypothetical protein